MADDRGVYGKVGRDASFALHVEPSCDQGFQQAQLYMVLGVQSKKKE